MYGTYNPQITRDRINQQITQLQQMRDNLPDIQSQTPAINQTFQLAPTNQGVMKYANTYEEVQREAVFSDTPFFSKDLSVMWLKNTKGEIKAYELKEIVQKDEKDLQIEYLMNEINKLKGMVESEQHITNVNRENVSTSSADNNETIREQVKDDKSSNVQRVSRSKTK